MLMFPETTTLCPQCRGDVLEYRVLQATGDYYGFCRNFPDCTFVTPLLETPP